MGFLDKLKDLASKNKGAVDSASARRRCRVTPMGFLDKVKSLVSQNADKVDQAIDKAADIVDQKTQGKYASQVDKVQDAAKNAVDKTPPQSPSS